MADRFEGLVRAVFELWKKDASSAEKAHPGEEEFACLLEGRLKSEEERKAKEHLLSCRSCAEAFSLRLSLKEDTALEVPPELLASVSAGLAAGSRAAFLEVILGLGQRAIEIISTGADVLLGQELIPAPLVRSRAIKGLRDEINIIKDFPDIIVEAKIENRQGRCFNLNINVKDKASQRLLKDLRITLIKEGLELESYISDSGRVVFENVLIGRYTVEISSPSKNMAAILLDIRSI